MSGTDLAYGRLRSRYAMSGTDLAYGARSLSPSASTAPALPHSTRSLSLYAIPGTDLAYDAIRLRAPLCDPRY
eukprot:246957-Rhodomonas_salina.1